MTQISTADLEYMRSCIEDLLPDTCNILSLTRTSDGQGSWTEAWGTATAGVPCRLDPLQGVEQLSASSVRPYHAYTLTLAHDAAIATTNQVEVGSDTFTVVSVDDTKSWAASRRCRLERIDE